MSWGDAYISVVKKTPAEDSLELRTSFLENCLTDEWGELVEQAELHHEIQGALWRWQQGGYHNGIISAPFGGGKSQQLPIGLGLYLQTRLPEISQGIITASPNLSKKRIRSVRLLVEKDIYKQWCVDHHLSPLEYSRSDSYSSEQIFFKSKNTTGNPSFEAAGIETGGTGQRFWVLWGDDICDIKDFHSAATRDTRHKSWTNTWSSRVYDGGFRYLIRTPYHPDDANERLIKSGIYNHLEIAVNEDKTAYQVKEWELGELVRQDRIPLWERNHSYEKLCDAEKEDYAAYQLGYRMQKEVQNPKLSTYLSFSDQEYPLGNVGDFEFDWMSSNPLVLTADFNVNPMAWALGQVQGENYVVLDQIMGKNVTTESQAIVAADKIIGMGHNFVELHGDGTSNQGGARYGRSGENDWMVLTKVLENKGIAYRKKVKKSNPQRNERVKVVNNVICSNLEGQAKRRLLIDRSCGEVIDDYKYSVRDDNELKKKRQGDRGHISDAVDYWIYRNERSGNRRMLIR